MHRHLNLRRSLNNYYYHHLTNTVIIIEIRTLSVSLSALQYGKAKAGGGDPVHDCGEEGQATTEGTREQAVLQAAKGAPR